MKTFVISLKRFANLKNYAEITLSDSRNKKKEEKMPCVCFCLLIWSCAQMIEGIRRAMRWYPALKTRVEESGGECLLGASVVC